MTFIREYIARCKREWARLRFDMERVHEVIEP